MNLGIFHDSPRMWLKFKRSSKPKRSLGGAADRRGPPTNTYNEINNRARFENDSRGWIEYKIDVPSISDFILWIPMTLEPDCKLKCCGKFMAKLTGWLCSVCPWRNETSDSRSQNCRGIDEDATNILRKTGVDNHDGAMWRNARNAKRIASWTPKFN